MASNGTIVAEAGGADTDAVAALLRARALADWRALHDPVGERNADALAEAASLAEILVDGRCSRFEPIAFGELVGFIEAMPF